MQDVDLKRFEKLNLETHQFLMLQHWQGFLDKNLKILFTPVSEDTLKIVEQVRGNWCWKNVGMMSSDFQNLGKLGS